MYKQVLLLLTLFICSSTFAQTVTINYQTWSGASGCNIFASAVNVNAVPHRTAIGQPTYSTTNHTVDLECSGTTGTEYAITYDFKQGFSYKITVKASNIKSNSANANSNIRLNLTNGGSGVSTSCSGPQTIDVSLSGNMKQSLAINTGSYTDYVINYSVLANPFSHMMVAAVPTSGTGLQAMVIRSIIIEETLVNPELSLTPTSVNTSCGNSITQTFTLNNPHNVPGITSYDWNLGSSNGWIYNGSPAPSTITTTGNSIALSTNCLSASPGNVSVTALKSGVAYKSYTATVNYNATVPPATITGPAGLCHAENYMAGTFPACGGGVTYTWSKSSNLNLSGSGSTVSVSPASGGGGAAWIEVTMSSNCGSSTYRKNVILESIPEITGGTYTNPFTGYGTLVAGGANVICGLNTGSVIDFTTVGGNMDTYIDIAGPPATPAWSGAPNMISFDGFTYWSQYVVFTVTLTNSCGSNTYEFPFYPNPCEPALRAEVSPFSVYPNPATSNVYVEPIEVSKDKKVSDYSIKLFTDKGALLKTQHNKSTPGRITINTSNLPEGIYYLHITQQGKVYKKQVLIKR